MPKFFVKKNELTPKIMKQCKEQIVGKEKTFHPLAGLDSSQSMQTTASGKPYNPNG